MNANEILDREFLEMRARIIELAACFDRMDRAEGDISSDRRYQLIQQGLEILTQDERDRAEQIQLLFSRQYEDDWQDRFDLST